MPSFAIGSTTNQYEGRRQWSIVHGWSASDPSLGWACHADCGRVTLDGMRRSIPDHGWR
jgi:hypothetical protein